MRLPESIVCVALSAFVAAGCSDSTGGGGTASGSTAAGAGVGPVGSQLPTPQRADDYQFDSVQVSAVATNSVVGLGVAPVGTDVLALQSGTRTIEYVDGSGAASEMSFFVPVESIAATTSMAYVGTRDDITVGNGDVFRREVVGGTPVWNYALDTTRDEANVALVQSEILAMAGGPGQGGELYQLDQQAGTFDSIATLGSVTPTAVTVQSGAWLVGGTHDPSGEASFQRVLGGAVEDVGFPYGNPGQRVTDMVTVDAVAPVGSRVTVVAVGRFNGNGAPAGGQVLATNGRTFERLASFGGDAPTSLAAIDDTIYVGTAEGRLQYHDFTGSGAQRDHEWVDEPGLPDLDAIHDLLVRDDATLQIGGRGPNGSILVNRVGSGNVSSGGGNGGGAPTPGGGGGGNLTYTADVKPILSQNCTTCHNPMFNALDPVMRLSQGLSDDDGDYALISARVNTASPATSLLLIKATGGQGHLGGTPLQDTDPEYQTLLDWIEQGAPQQ